MNRNVCAPECGEVASVLHPRLALVAGWSTVFLALHVAELAQLAPTVARSYLDDVLCLPLVLTLLQVVSNLVVPDRPVSSRLAGMHLLAGRPAWWQGALALVYVSVVFELVLPRIADGFTGDVKDVLAYAVGWLVFEVGWRLTDPDAGARTGAGKQEAPR